MICTVWWVILSGIIIIWRIRQGDSFGGWSIMYVQYMCMDRDNVWFWNSLSFIPTSTCTCTWDCTCAIGYSVCDYILVHTAQKGHTDDQSSSDGDFWVIIIGMPSNLYSRWLLSSTVMPVLKSSGAVYCDKLLFGCVLASFSIIRVHNMKSMQTAAQSFNQGTDTPEARQARFQLRSTDMHRLFNRGSWYDGTSIVIKKQRSL